MAVVTLYQKIFPEGNKEIVVNSNEVITIYRNSFDMIVVILSETDSENSTEIQLDQSIHGSNDTDVSVVADQFGFAPYTEKIFPDGSKPIYINPDKIKKIEENIWGGTEVTYIGVNSFITKWIEEDLSTATTIAQDAQNTISLRLSPSPVADFSMSPSTGTPSISITFTDLSTNTPTSWLWDFGDGTISKNQNTSHLFSVPGSYSISLQVMNDFGSNSITKSIVISIDETVISPKIGFAIIGKSKIAQDAQ